MVDIRLGDRGALVAALQVLINRLADATIVAVDGIYGTATQTALQEVQRRLPGMQPHGRQVAGSTWAELVRREHLSVISCNDIYDPRHDEVAPAALRGPNLISVSGMSGGVGHVVHEIERRARASGPIVLLRFFGHGAPGLMGVTGGTGSLRDMQGETIRDERGRPVRPDHALERTTISNESWPGIEEDLASLRPLFAPFGSVELHGCRVGRGDEGRRLLARLAATLGVPASAGVQSQWFGATTAFRFEGPVSTVYPDRLSLATWTRRLRLLGTAT
jgi:hypothetical protein